MKVRKCYPQPSCWHRALPERWSVLYPLDLPDAWLAACGWVKASGVCFSISNAECPRPPMFFFMYNANACGRDHALTRTRGVSPPNDAPHHRRAPFYRVWTPAVSRASGLFVIGRPFHSPLPFPVFALTMKTVRMPVIWSQEGTIIINQYSNGI